MQIGPRIRVGGSLGKFGDKAKKVGGKLARNPLVQVGLGALTGGATIPALIGALGGGLKEHAGIGDVVKGGAQGAAAGYGGEKLRGGFNAVRGALGSPSVESLASGPIPKVGTIASPAAASPVAPSQLGTARSALSRVGEFVAKNPTAAGMGLNAASNLATAGTENRINEAQADLLEQKAGETAYDFEQRKRREEAMKGLWSPLGQTIGSSFNGIAKNPYLPGA